MNFSEIDSHYELKELEISHIASDASFYFFIILHLL